MTVLLLAACAGSTPPLSTAPIAPSSSGHAAVNGIELYHEIYGDGPPLVLLHGGLMTIAEMAPVLQPLAQKNRVIAVELQGHGRTVDTDRPLKWETLADDVAALLDHLAIEEAVLVGYSLGGAVAIRTSIQHPKKVRRLVVMSNPFAHTGWYPEAREGMAQVSGALAEAMKDTPVAKAAQKWPEPQRFPQFLDKIGKLISENYDWSAEMAKLPMPVLLLYADNDSISQKHIAEFFALLGGGIKEPGWQNTKLSKARLAVVPGYSHYNFGTAPEVGAIINKYLADPLTGKAPGAAEASTTAP
jgi:pimeloyl-ACP methyl ester carboxylesterase